MLIFPLKKEWYEKIRSGEKTVEYREVKPYWSQRILIFTRIPMPFFRNIEFFRSRRPNLSLILQRGRKKNGD